MNVNSKDLFENHLALLVAIRCEMSAEQAFNRVERLLKTPFGSGRIVSKDDDQFMVAMADKGYLQSYIGKMYGLSPSAVSYRIKRYRERVS